MVVADVRGGVGGERPEVVNAAAYAVSVSASGALFPAVGLVVLDVAVADRGARASLNGETAALCVPKTSSAGRINTTRADCDVWKRAYATRVQRWGNPPTWETPTARLAIRSCQGWRTKFMAAPMRPWRQA